MCYEKTITISTFVVKYPKMLMNMTEPTLLAITGPAALVFMAVFILVTIFPVIFYLLTLQGTLREISRENRRMQPEQVWLSLIPIFGIVWQYFIVSRVADSLYLEFRKRNIYIPEQKPGYNFGIAYCILITASIIPMLGLLALLGGGICWVLYWIKISEYRSRLRENPPNFIEI
jgi:hypothetical protein